MTIRAMTKPKNFKMFLSLGRVQRISDLADDNREEATWMSADHLNRSCGHTPVSYYNFIPLVCFSLFCLLLFAKERQGKFNLRKLSERDIPSPAYLDTGIY